MMREAEARKLAKIIKPYGLEIIKTRRHRKIMKDGHLVCVTSGTPGCPHFVENTLQILRRRGLIPAHVGRA